MTLFTGKGTIASVTGAGGYVDYEILGGNLFVHDVFVDPARRGRGVGTAMVAEVLGHHPDKTPWTASTSRPMDRICHNLGFVLARKKNRRGDVPPPVAYTNANVFRGGGDS